MSSMTAAPAAQGTTRHWLVAAGAVLCMIAGSVPLSGLSFYHPYLFSVYAAQGVPQAEVLLYFTLLMLSIVGSMVFIGGPLLPKLGTKVLMIGGALVVAAALVLFALATSTVMLYAAGVLLGLGYGVSFQLVPMVWVNNWFVARKGFVVGLVMGGTGIGGVLWSVIVPMIGGTPSPENQTFRTGYYVMAAAVVALTLVGALLLANPEHPAKAGLRALGAGDAASKQGQDDAAAEPGLPFKDALRSPWLWLLYGVTLLLGIIHGASQIMAPYLMRRAVLPPPEGLGQTLAFYSLLMAVWTIGLIFLKPALGVLNDKIGVIGGLAVFLVLQAIFFVLMPNFGALGSLLAPAAMLLMSAGMATGTVQPPLLTAQAMGNRDFAKIWSVTGSAYTLGLAVGAPIWGLFYDPADQSYTRGFYLGPIAMAVVVAGAFIAVRAGRRQYLPQGSAGPEAASARR